MKKAIKTRAALSVAYTKLIAGTTYVESVI